LKETIYLVMGALITLIFKLIYDKIRSKSVKLFHYFDNPAEFSTFSPTTIFQSLTIRNEGELPSKGIQVFLKSDVLESTETEYKPVTEDKYEVEKRDGFDIIRLERLLPKENLVISFKSAKMLPNEVLTRIKSEEKISNARDPNNSGSFFESNFMFIMLFLVAMVPALFYIGFLIGYKGVTENSGISIVISTEPSSVAAGDSITIETFITNVLETRIDDFYASVDIPGFNLPLLSDTFLNLSPGQSRSYRRVLQISREQKPGRYFILYETFFNVKDQRYTESVSTTITVTPPN